MLREVAASITFSRTPNGRPYGSQCPFQNWYGSGI